MGERGRRCQPRRRAAPARIADIPLFRSISGTLSSVTPTQEDQIAAPTPAPSHPSEGHERANPIRRQRPSARSLKWAGGRAPTRHATATGSCGAAALILLIVCSRRACPHVPGRCRRTWGSIDGRSATRLSILHRVTGVALALGLARARFLAGVARGRGGQLPDGVSGVREPGRPRCSWPAGASRFSITSSTACAICSGMRAGDSSAAQRHASGWFAVLGAADRDGGSVGASVARRAAVSLRSPLGRVLGSGSAKDGTARWWAERVSVGGARAADALVPVLAAAPAVARFRP